MAEFVFEDVFCPRYHRAVELVGKRWSGAVLRALLLGRSGYSELREAVPGLSDTMLAARLKELEHEGVVRRVVDAGPPMRAHYVLTDKGRALEGAIRALSEWAEAWLPLAGEADGEGEPGAQGGSDPTAERAKVS